VTLEQLAKVGSLEAQTAALLYAAAASAAAFLVSSARFRPPRTGEAWPSGASLRALRADGGRLAAQGFERGRACAAAAERMLALAAQGA
jgi:hypothetical protein